MKTAKQSILPKVRNYGKNTTKKNLNESQVLLEIRNFTKIPIQISAKNDKFELIHLHPDQMKKGVCIKRSDSALINALLKNLIDKTLLTVSFLQRINIELNKPNIEKWLYTRFHDIYFYNFGNNEGDYIEPAILQKDGSLSNTEDQDQFFNNMNKSQDELLKEHLKKAKEENQLLYEKNLLKPQGIIEAIEFYKFDNLSRNGKMISGYFEKWVKSLNNTDFQISAFTKEYFDQFIRCIQNTKKDKKSSKNDSEFYGIETIKNIVTQTKILFKNLSDEQYKINDYQRIREFTLKMGNKRNSHINYNYSATGNVISINYAEFQTIKKAINDKSLSIEERNTAKLFVIQTLLGGLRHSELELIEKDKFTLLNGKYKLHIVTPKTKKGLDSIVSEDLLPILQSIDFNVKNILNYTYNSDLKALAKKLNLNREIEYRESTSNANEQNFKVFPLHQLICNKFARKAFITILHNEKNYSIDQIISTTKQARETIKFYLADLENENEKMMNIL